MSQISVINTIIVPSGMETTAELVLLEYVSYFIKQEGFVSSTFYKSINREQDGSVKYVNTIVWESCGHFEKVVNKGFDNEFGENKDGMKVLGKGFPEPIKVSPGQYVIVSQTIAE